MDKRIRALETHIRAAGCPTCREWSTPQKIEIMREEEDAANPLPHIPATCPTCGRAIERQKVRRIVIRRVDRATA